MKEENQKKDTKTDLPPIPDRRYFTIGEASMLCAVKPHVLRYWEQEFKQLNPSKRRGNRRYYQRDDVLIIREIRKLLYDQGYTIDGARQCLTGAKKERLTGQETVEVINASIVDLEEIQRLLEKAEA